jgi:HPt (histidine-containing phosphotransfer) domain-containing protein
MDEERAQEDAEEAVLDASRIEMHRRLEPGDPTLLHRALTAFLDSAPEALQSIRAAVADGSPGDLAWAAHRMRGGALHLGANRLAAVCGELEDLGDDGNVEAAGPVLPRLTTELGAAVAALRDVLGGCRS